MRLCLLPDYPNLSTPKLIPDVEAEDRRKQLTAIGVVNNSTVAVETLIDPKSMGVSGQDESTPQPSFVFAPEEGDAAAVPAAAAPAASTSTATTLYTGNGYGGSSYGGSNYSSSNYNYSSTYSRPSTPEGSFPGRAPALGVTGLNNLGNTCYMNSALQCLLNVPVLRHYLLSGAYKADLNTDNPLGWNGEVAQAFAALMRRVFSLKRFGSVSPTAFKRAIGKCNQLFVGYGQQDSQELLGFLMDGLHEDLNRVLKKPPTEKIEGTEFPDDLSAAQEAWRRHLLRNSSVMVDLFQGQFRSSVVCGTCHKQSITFDPYMYLSLPLPVNTDKELEFLFYPRPAAAPGPGAAPAPIHRLRLLLPRYASFLYLKRKVSEIYGVPVEHLLVREVFQHRFFMSTRCSDTDLVSQLLENDLMCFFEVQPYKNTPPPLPPRPSLANRAGPKEDDGIRVTGTGDADDAKQDDQRDVDATSDATGDAVTITITDADGHDRGAGDESMVDIELGDMSGRAAPPPDEADDHDDAPMDVDNEPAAGDAPAATTEATATAAPAADDERCAECAICTTWLPKSHLYAHLECTEDCTRGVCDACFQDFQKANEDAAQVAAMLLLVENASFKCPLCLTFDQEQAWERLAEPSAEDDDLAAAATAAATPPPYSYAAAAAKPAAGAASSSTSASPPPTYTRFAHVSVLHRRASSGVSSYSRHELFGYPFVLTIEIGKITGAELHEQVRAHLRARGVLRDAPPPAEADPGSDAEGDTASSAAAPSLSADALSSSADALSSASSASTAPVPGDDTVIDMDVDGAADPTVSVSRSSSVSSDAPLPVFRLYCTDDTGLICRACTYGYSYSSRCSGCQPIADSADLVVDMRTDTLVIDWLNDDCCDAEALDCLTDHESMATPRLKDTPVSLDACFRAFAKPETLEGNDAWYCPSCKEFRQAEKTMGVWAAPDTIVVHLKRFASIGHYREKIENYIAYPVEGLDLAPYLLGPQRGDPDGCIYDLIAISNHMGGLTGGHYIAYAFNTM